VAARRAAGANGLATAAPSSPQQTNVVRYWSAPVMLDARTGRAEWRQTVTLPADWKRENLGIAALVQDVKAGEVLQVVSMPGCA